MSSSVAPLAEDLAATQDELAALLAALAPDAWDLPTPAPGWMVRHQVHHLAFGEELGALAVDDPAAFGEELTRLLADLSAVEAAQGADADDSPEDLAARWRANAERLRQAVLRQPADRRISWITGPMSRASFLTARVMETFAHGHDIAVATGRSLDASRALAHVAHLGVATRAFSYANRGLAVPDGDVRVELEDGAGVRRSWGPADSAEVVEGPLLDFCLLVTRRVHRADTALVTSGPLGEEWLAIAQCYAGPPSDGPASTAT
jgi:uncharacterized protein (TIGR03084 family)